MTKSEYLLICLQEECGEVIQTTSKCLRFGLDNHHPNSDEENWETLTKELVHVQAIIQELVQGAVVGSHNYFPQEHSAKIRRLNKYMDVSKDCGILERK